MRCVTISELNREPTNLHHALDAKLLQLDLARTRDHRFHRGAGCAGKDHGKMKDFLMRELALDDYVIFKSPYGANLKLGKIIKFTPRQIRVEYPGWRGEMTSSVRYSKEVVKVEGPDLTFFLLSKQNQS